MSGEDSGYVPPDHQRTTEFRLPGKPSAEPRGSGPDETAVDGPGAPGEPPAGDAVDEGADRTPVGDAGGGETVTDVPGTSGETMVDVPRDDDEVEVTIVDRPVSAERDDDPPATVTDLPEQGPPPQPSGPDPEGRTEPHRVPQGGEAPWTAQFGAEQGARPDQEAGSEQEARPGQGARSEQEARSEQPPPGPPVGPAVAGAAAESPTAPTPVLGHGAPVGPAPSHVAAEAPTAPTSMRAESQQGPPGAPPATPFAPSPQQPSSGRSSRRPALLIAAVAAVAAVLVLGAGAAATLLMSGDSDDPTTARSAPPTTAPATSAGPSTSVSPTTSASPGAVPSTTAPGAAPGQSGAPSGTPAPTAGQPSPSAPATTPPAGPLKPGDGISYQLVQRDPGYFEGRLVITNRGAEPMKGWRLTFEVPGGHVRNIWGGELVRRGSKVEIRSLDGAAPIEPGGTWEVQYGAAGSAADPKGCRLDGRPCGF
ncbi:cellulose binding domain-containing protein [Spirillospora sp. NPDC050679]